MSDETIGKMSIEAVFDAIKAKTGMADVTTGFQKLLAESAKLDPKLSANERSVARLADKLRTLSPETATRKLADLGLAVDKAGASAAKSGPQFDVILSRFQKLKAAGADLSGLPSSLNSVAAAAEKLGKVDLSGVFKGELASQAQGLAGGLGSFGGVLTKIGPAGMAAGAGLAIMAAGSKLVIDKMVAASQWANTVSDAADSMGATAIEAQQLQHAALEGGQSFEAATGSVIKMRKALIDSPDAFLRMGLAIGDLRKMNLPDLLTTVGGAVAGIKDPNEQAAIAVQIFGKSWKEVAPLIKGGLASMKDAPVVSNEVVAALNGQNAKINVLGEAWDHLWISFSAAAAKGSGTVSILDMVTGALNRVSKAIDAIGSIDLGRIAAATATVGASELYRAGAIGAKAVGTNLSGENEANAKLSLVEAAAHANNQRVLAARPAVSTETVLGESSEQITARLTKEGEARKAVMASEKDLAAARLLSLPALQREVEGIRLSTEEKVKQISLNGPVTEAQSKEIDNLQKAATLQVAAARSEHDRAVSQRELEASNAVAGARDKLTLDSFEQQVRGIERARDAKVHDIETSHEEADVKAKLIQLTKDEAAANIAAAKAADMISFGADDAENQRNLDNLVKQFERVNKELDEAGRKMSAGGIADFRKRLSELSEATPAAGKLGSISDKEFGELGTSGGQRKAALEAENDVVEKGKGLWERKRVAADEANQAEIDGAKKVRDGLEDEIRLIVLAAQKSQQLGGIFSQLGSIAGTLGSGFGSNALGGVGGIFGAVSGLQSLKAKSLTEHVSGLEMFSSKLGIAGAGINLGMTLVNGIKSAFVKSESEKVAGDLGKKFGVKFTDVLGKAIEETEKSKGLGRDMAELLNLDKIMGESGLDPSRFKKQIGDLLNATALGTVKKTDGIDAISKAFVNLKTAAEGGSVASETAMTAMIHRAKELGLAIPEIDTFVRDTLKDAAANLETFFKGQGSEILTKMRNGSGPDGADSVTGAVSAKQAEANQVIFGAVFKAEAALNGLVATAEDTQKAFEEMVRSLPSGTVLTGQAAEVAQILEALKNPLYKGAADTASSGAKIFADLRKTDNLSPEVVGAFETTLQTGMDEARKGLEGIPNLTEDQQRRLTEQANLPMLVEMQHARAAGMHLDAATEKALAQADADHLLPALSIAEQQLAVQKQIRDGLTGDPTTPDPNAPDPNAPPPPYDGPPPNDFGGHGTNAGNHQWIPGLATGGYVSPTSDGTIVRLGEGGEGEFVTPMSAVDDFVQKATSGEYAFHAPKGASMTTAEMSAIAAAGGRGAGGTSNADVVAALARVEGHLRQQGVAFGDLPFLLRKALKS